MKWRKFEQMSSAKINFFDRLQIIDYLWIGCVPDYQPNYLAIIRHRHDIPRFNIPLYASLIFITVSNAATSKMFFKIWWKLKIIFDTTRKVATRKRMEIFNLRVSPSNITCRYKTVQISMRSVVGLRTRVMIDELLNQTCSNKMPKILANIFRNNKIPLSACWNNNLIFDIFT